ncbi:MAG TPA: family 20 glycosylhydrolase [Bacteroidales bacterium]|nr:family 20 glycosylhydrolase [Bacteroidales bacterium]
MKKILSFLLFISCITASGQSNKTSIIPLPVEIQQSSGSFILNGSSTIGFSSPEARMTAEMFSAAFNRASGFSIRAQQANTASVMFSLNNTPAANLGKEGYTLESNQKGVIIAANTAAGLFYGMQSLLQLLPEEVSGSSAANTEWTVPYTRITDYPRFAWRGLMLDVSRHFFPKEDVKAFIDQMVQFKYNTFHWHLTDDNGWRVEINSLPKLTQVGAWRVERYGAFNQRIAPKAGEKATYGGFYTQDDIKEIVQYAAERHVTIVPEVDIPGHSLSAIAAYPELSCTREPQMVNPGSSMSEWYSNGTFKITVDNTLNPSDEKVYEFLDKVFTEIAALFPGEYIHAGGDECYKGYWEKDPNCQALMKKNKMKNAEELQSYFMTRVEKIIKSKGKRMIGWDEILEGGLAPEATVMSWRSIKGGIEAAKLGHNVVMSPTTFAYLDYQQGEPTIEAPMYASLRLKKCYSFNPVPEGVDAKLILGGQGNLWTEQIPHLRYAEYMVWPRALALSEVYWSKNESKNWDDFIVRAERQMKRFDLEGVNYSKAIYDPVINTTMKGDKMTLEMETEASGIDIYYTLDNTMPDNHSQKYTGPVDVPEGPVSLRVITYRNDKPVGHLIILKPEELKKR